MITREQTTTAATTNETNAAALLAGAHTYLTPAEFAARYPEGPTLGTIANWRSEALRTGVNAGPPFTRIGGRIYYALSGILAWERRRTIA